MSKVWLITGSSRGLGRALAEAVLAVGHKLVATARTPSQLDDLVKGYGNADKKWRDLSISTDFEAGDTHTTYPWERK